MPCALFFYTQALRERDTLREQHSNLRDKILGVRESVDRVQRRLQTVYSRRLLHAYSYRRSLLRGIAITNEVCYASTPTDEVCYAECSFITDSYNLVYRENCILFLFIFFLSLLATALVF